MKKNRIIVMTDLSDHSQNLVEFAFSLSDMIDAKVLFVHQISAATPAMADLDTKDEIIKVEKAEALSMMRQLALGRIQDQGSFVISPSPVLNIIHTLKSEVYTDWVLAGLKGTGILKRLFMGSTTLSIINESDLLTIAVPVQVPITVPKNLIVGVTSRFPLNIPQFEIVLSSFKHEIKELEFFSVLQDDEDEEIAHNHLTSLRIKYADYHASSYIAKGNNKLETLKSHIEQKENPFLVLQQGSRSLEDKLFRTFMINELVYTALIPLIVLSK